MRSVCAFLFLGALAVSPVGVAAQNANTGAGSSSSRLSLERRIALYKNEVATTQARDGGTLTYNHQQELKRELKGLMFEIRYHQFWYGKDL